MGSPKAECRTAGRKTVSGRVTKSTGKASASSAGNRRGHADKSKPNGGTKWTGDQMKILWELRNQDEKVVFETIANQFGKTALACRIKFCNLNTKVKNGLPFEQIFAVRQNVTKKASATKAKASPYQPEVNTEMSVVAETEAYRHAHYVAETEFDPDETEVEDEVGDEAVGRPMAGGFPRREVVASDAQCQQCAVERMELDAPSALSKQQDSTNVTDEKLLQQCATFRPRDEQKTRMLGTYKEEFLAYFNNVPNDDSAGLAGAAPAAPFEQSAEVSQAANNLMSMSIRDQEHKEPRVSNIHQMLN